VRPLSVLSSRPAYCDVVTLADANVVSHRRRKRLPSPSLQQGAPSALNPGRFSLFPSLHGPAAFQGVRPTV